MKIDLAGKIKNTRLPVSKALLPMFEAVVNSFQAIEDAGGSVPSPHIEIRVERASVLDGMDLDGEIEAFSITDNGVGFDEINLDSFFTSDTQYKVGRGGKGLGRFIWLKAFQVAEIESHYRDNSLLLKRAFKFTTSGEQPTGTPELSSEREARTTVRLVGMKSPFRENCPRGLDLIGRRLIEHCLPFFLNPKCPAISIEDAKNRIDLHSYFQQIAAKATQYNFTVKDSTFTLKGLQIYNPAETHHRLSYAADFREVMAEKLEKYLPNLHRRLVDSEGESFVYLGFIEGDYLNANANGERTSFSFSSGDDKATDDILGEITLSAIRAAALTHVSADLEPFLEEINSAKRSAITSYITHEAPQYRPLIRYMPEFIDKITPGAGGRTLEMALHEQMYEKQRELKQESHALIQEGEKQALRPEEYEAKLKDFLERANELGKSSLAEYIAHRKVILEFLEKSLQQNPETGKYRLEEIIHKIIYPMRTTSDDVPYEQQNLWIIDERLSYHGFLASDLPLDSVDVLANDSKSRPDLLIFDRALTFAEDDAALNSMVIVEFKKPDRSSFGKEDPIEQVYRLVREIRSGHFKDKTGREIKVQSSRIPAYAYVVCDTTKEVETIAENKGLQRTPDNLGFYGYNQPLLTYVEVISYVKLLRDAKKRNKVLFEKLHLPSA